MEGGFERHSMFWTKLLYICFSIIKSLLTKPHVQSYTQHYIILSRMAWFMVAGGGFMSYCRIWHFFVYFWMKNLIFLVEKLDIFGWKIWYFWLKNWIFLVEKLDIFGWKIGYFWLKNWIFLVEKLDIFGWKV